MSYSNECKLKEVIDIISLQYIQDKYSKLNNISAITVDSNGFAVSKPSNCSKFCTLVRSSKKGYNKCINCNSKFGIKSINLKKSLIWKCHAGLTGFSVPIIIDNNYLGAMLFGQIVTHETYKDAIDIDKLSNELDLSAHDLSACLSQINIIPHNRLADIADFLDSIINLITKIIKKRLELDNLAKDLKLKSIQPKVSSHFLFNSLNTIARMALLESAVNTEDLIYALSDILRYSSSNSYNLVTLKNEIDYTKKYLYIQTTRYSDKIKYKINLQDNILNYKVPAMIIQPIAENSIIHGLEPKKDGGILTIDGYLDNKNIILQISDNGIGMNSNIIDLILDKAYINPNCNNLSIQNVDNRIKYHFGKAYGISIKSLPDKGTIVYINLPCVL